MEQLMFKVSLDEGGGKDLNGVSILLVVWGGINRKVCKSIVLF